MPDIISFDDLDAFRQQAQPPAPAAQQQGVVLFDQYDAQRRQATAAPPAQQLDESTGAPWRVRALVGGAPDQDRLANLQSRYPDARPHGDDNFVFTNPDTGRPTLYNPRGMDVGDLASLARPATQAVGAGLAGAAAGIGAIPTGGVAAPIAVPIAAGAGSAAAGNVYDVFMRYLGGMTDSRGGGERLRDAAGDVLAEGAGSAIGAGVGRATRQLSRSTLGNLTRYILGGRGASNRLTDIEAQGVTPTAGLVSTRRPVHGMESALGNVPSSAGTMQTAAERTRDEVAGRVRSLADEYASASGLPTTATRSAQDIGNTVQQGARAASERFTQRQEQLYAAAYDQIGRNTPTPVTNVATLEADVASLVNAAPNSFAPTVQQALTRMQAVLTDARNSGGAIPFDVLRQIRTDIGRDIDNPVLAGSRGSANDNLRRLYGAITEDLNAVARQSPEGGRALAQADRYTRFNMTQNVPTLQRMSDADTSGQVFNTAMSGSRESADTLMRLRRNLAPEEWDRVAGGVLGRMGIARPGAQDATGEMFSVNTFLTNWNSLSREAREALFSRGRYAQIAPALDQIARVASYARDIDRMANPSGTARHLIYLQALGGVGLDASGGMGAGTAQFVAPYAAAKLMTNPTFARWLARTIGSRADLAPNGIAAQLSRLASIEPGISEELDQYISVLGLPTDQRGRQPPAQGR